MPAHMTHSFNHRPKRSRKNIVLAIIAAVFVFLVIGGALWFNVSPTPSALIVRGVLDNDAKSLDQAQQEFVGNNLAVSTAENIRYREEGELSLFDVYVPTKAFDENEELPLIIWTHGGAWISGDKSYNTAYFRLLASKGFVVVALNYDLAPEHTYDYQLHQINEAHGYLIDHAAEFNIDINKIVLAGSSAGAQLSAQLAALITNKSYAEELNILPQLDAQQLSAVVLYSGIYDMQKLASAEGISSSLIAWGFKTATWAYTGERSPSNFALYQASVIHHLDSKFPPSFISGGNGDALTKLQSIPFAASLENHNVEVVTRFFADNHKPELKHENQFVFDDDGIKTFEAMCVFLENTHRTNENK